jgi:hypothetical protein
MAYEYLKLIDAEDQGEAGRESSHRRRILASYENAIKLKLAAIDACKAERAGGPKIATNIPPFGSQGRVAALAKFHQGQQDSTVKLDKLNAENIKLRLWIARQGASVKPDGSIDWPKSYRTVQYDTELAKRDVHRLNIRGGLLYKADGTPFDTGKLATNHTGPGFGIYVMSAEGNIYAGGHAVGHRHHSSFLAGGAVAGAGEMEVHNGRLLWISNKSGHYRPDFFMLFQVLEELRSAGVPMNFRITTLGADDKEDNYASPEAFLKGSFADDATYRYDKLVKKYGASTLGIFLVGVGEVDWSIEERSFTTLYPAVRVDFDAVVKYIERLELVPFSRENTGEIQYKTS